MPSDLTKAAHKCVNEFVERAEGNWKMARALWKEELAANAYGPKFAHYVHEVYLAFDELAPR